MTSAAADRPVDDLLVGVLGGTGPLGRGLAARLAAAGQRVLLGDPDADRARAVAAEVAGLAAAAGGGEVSVRGGADADVAGAADLVVVAVPFADHAATLTGLAEALAGKVVVDAVVPLGTDDLGTYLVDVAEGSAAQQAAALLPDSAVVGAFHTVPVMPLADLARPTVDADVLVAGDDPAATATAQALAGRLPGMRGVYAGPLRNARHLEAMAVVLGAVDERYGAAAGLRVTDV
ncbi:NADPH-dependent F420 reductase [Geodermatophilus sp. SYSU D01119]